MAQQLREALDRQREQSRITIIRRFEVERRVGLSRSAIYRRISEGKFPQPVPLGGGDDAHAVGWIESEIDDYVIACIAARDAKVTP
jgi:prophage regulatory protein